MRAVLFDIDGVLLHSRFHPDVAKRRLWDAHLLEDLGIDPEDFAKLFGPAFADVITGKRSLVELLDEFLPSIGFRGSSMDVIAYWMERDINPNNALFEAIKRLKNAADVRLFLATNQEHVRANYMWQHLRLNHIFDDMFYAARLRVKKPDPQFFKRVDRHLPQSAEKPLFFDDSPSVVEGANNHGWEAVLFNDLADFTEHEWVRKQLK